MLKKGLSLILLLSIVSVSFIGCVAKPNETPDDSSDANNDVTSTTPLVTTENPNDENGYLKDKIPLDAALTKTEINMICGGGGDENLWKTDGPAIAVIDNAVYSRNSQVEKRLGCTLNITWEPVGWNEHFDFYDKVTNSITANDKKYDIVTAYSPTMPMFVNGGFSKQLNALDYLDFSAPWWPESINNELTIEDRLFMASGDACLGVFDASYVIFFNRDIASQYELGDLYDIVLEGNFTLDVFTQMLEKFETDGQITGMEYYAEAYVSAFISSLDIKITENNSNGIPFMTFGTQSVIEKTEKLTSLFASSSVLKSTTIKSDFNSAKVFAYISDMKDARISLQESSVKWGCVPCPKYSAEQDNYKVWMSTGFGLFIIPIDVADPDNSALFLECFASQSYRISTPAYYERAMKSRYAPDETTAQVFDVIRSGLDFQFGAMYGNQFTPCVFNVWRSNVETNSEEWNTAYARNSEVWEQQLSDMVNVIKELEP